MIKVITEEDLKPILDRLAALEKWKSNIQCPMCDGEGVIDDYHPHNGSNWEKCKYCDGLGLKENGKTYYEQL